MTLAPCGEARWAMFDEMRIETLLGKALGAAELRHQVIANNLANVDTPGFRAQRVVFEELLAQALERGEGGVEPKVVRANAGAPGPDGNDVRLEDQVGTMLKNSVLYKTYMRILAKRYRQMELAIRGTTSR